MKNHKTKVIAERMDRSYLKIARNVALAAVIATTSYCGSKPTSGSTSIPDPKITVAYDFNADNTTFDPASSGGSTTFLPTISWSEPEGQEHVNYSWRIDSSDWIVKSEWHQNSPTSWGGYYVGDPTIITPAELKRYNISLTTGTHVFTLKAKYENGEERTSRTEFTINDEAPYISIKTEANGIEITNSLVDDSYSKKNIYTYDDTTINVSCTMVKTDRNKTISHIEYQLGKIVVSNSGALTTSWGTVQKIPSGGAADITVEKGNTYQLQARARYSDGSVSDSTNVYYAPVSDVAMGTVFKGPLNERFDLVLRTPAGGYCAIGNAAQYSTTGDTSDILVCVYDDEMNLLFSRTFGGSNYDWFFGKYIQLQAAPALITSDGALLLAGYTSSTDGNAVGNHGGRDVLLMKIDLVSGNVLWQKTVGTANTDVPLSLYELASGNYVLVDYEIDPATANRIVHVECLGRTGNTLWSHAHDLGGMFIPYRTVFFDDGSYAFIHMNGSTVMATTYGSDGTQLSQKTAGTIGALLSISETFDGHYLVCGLRPSVSGADQDAVVIELDESFTVVADHQYGGTAADNFRTAFKRADGTYVLIGYTSSNDVDVAGNHGGGDIWIVFADGDTIRAQYCRGSTGSDYFVDALLLDDDSVALMYRDHPSGKTHVERYSADNDLLWEQVFEEDSGTFTGFGIGLPGIIVLNGTTAGSYGDNALLLELDALTGERI